jgi:5'/3'-nucleotidase
VIVLVTTDDGYVSESYRVLLHAVAGWQGGAHQVIGVAPVEDESGVGASQRTTPEFARVRVADRLELYALEGTPADCVAWALSAASGLPRPDLVVSGVNSIANVSAYMIELSGTVGAALTAAAAGLRAVAFSQDSAGYEVSYAGVPDRVPEGLEFALSLYARKKRQKKRTRRVCINVNLPNPTLAYRGVIPARVCNHDPQEGTPSHGSPITWKQLWTGSGPRSPLDTDALRQGFTTVSALSAHYG